jgi:hypothetical protein
MACVAGAALLGLTLVPITASGWSFQLGTPEPVTLNPATGSLRSFVTRDGHFSVMPSHQADHAYMIIYLGF